MSARPIRFGVFADPTEGLAGIQRTLGQIHGVAGIPDAEILKVMTINGYKCSETMDERGPIAPGLAADIIAVSESPLEDIDALRDVQFVMKDGLVFKNDSVVTPEKFFNAGPVNGWRIR